MSQLELDDGLSPLHRAAEYRELCEQSERRREEAQREARPRTFVAAPPDASDDTPALIALHAWGWNGKDALAAWQSVVDAGYV